MHNMKGIVYNTKAKAGLYKIKIYRATTHTHSGDISFFYQKVVMEMKSPAMLGRRAGSNWANTCLKKPQDFSASTPRWCNVALTETSNFSSVVVNDQYGCLLLRLCMCLWLVFSLTWVGSLFKLSKKTKVTFVQFAPNSAQRVLGSPTTNSRSLM